MWKDPGQRPGSRPDRLCAASRVGGRGDRISDALHQRCSSGPRRTGDGKGSAGCDPAGRCRGRVQANATTRRGDQPLQGKGGTRFGRTEVDIVSIRGGQ